MAVTDAGNNKDGDVLRTGATYVQGKALDRSPGRERGYW